MRAGILLAVSVLWPQTALAQDWATRAYCDTVPRPVTAADVAPLDLEALESKAQDIPNANGRLWKIESPGGAVSHLWGTFHVSVPAILDLPDVAKDRIASARVVAVETDFTFADRDAFLNQFNEPGRYRDPGDPFSMQEPLDLGFLDEDVEGWVYDRLNAYGTSEDALYVLTYPGLAAVLLADPCEDFFAGTVPVQDDLILTFGRIAGAEILSLETSEEFFSDLVDDEETARALIAVYASYLEPPSDNAGRAAMFQLYLEGRLGLLVAWDDAFVGRVLGDYGETALQLTNGYLLEFRNRRFMDRLEEPLAEGGVFIAVGAAHLPGVTGLVSLLEESGHKLTRVSLPGEVQ